MKNNTFRSVVSLFILMNFFFVQAQGVLREIPLSKKIEISSLLVEGKVMSKHSFWDADMQHIYTSNTVEIYKIFKGNIISSTIEIVTLGGVVGLEAEKVSPSLQLQTEAIGFFFLKNSDVNVDDINKGLIRFKPSIGAQSFYAYDLNEGTATGIFQEYENVSTTLYGEIYKVTNSTYKELKEFSIKKKDSGAVKSKVTMAVTSFSPTSISAGTRSVLTINGSDFGATKGSVKFRNADSGSLFGVTALDSQILSWSDTKITIEVPDTAGTGKIQVVTSGGSSSNSSTNLIIIFTEINVTYEHNGVEKAFLVQHADIDANGGYIWKMYIDFDANAAAKASFVRAMNSWRCNSKIYWEIDGTSTIDVAARDGTNIIRFDNGNELDDGTAGVCTSYYSGCIFNLGDEVAWFIAELDIVFDNFDAAGVNGVNWNYGPETPDFNEYDFESVAVHELGHGQQLGHVIDSDDFMNRSITNGSSKRVANENNLAAANDVQSRSVVFQQCGQSPMHNFDCQSLSVEDNILAKKIMLYPTFADKEIFISNGSLVPLKEVRFYDVRGLLVKKEQLKVMHTQKLNVEYLSAGMYFVQILSEKGTFSKKIIIK